MEYKQFESLLLSGTRRVNLSRQERLKAIWQEAAESIGCEAPEVLQFKAQIMVEGLKDLREPIRTTDKNIKEVCLHFS